MAAERTNTATAAPADPMAARFLPVVTTAAAALASIAPLRVSEGLAASPLWVLLAAYYWTLNRPDLLPPVTLFAIGLARDLVAGDPPGITPLALLLTRAVVMRYRRRLTDRGFPFIWAGFTLVALGVVIGLWLLQCMLASHLVDPRETVFPAVLTVALYPIATLMLGRTQQALMGASK